MKTLPEVETAKHLMNEAMRWSVMTWLREKKRVRKTADQANAALDRLSEELRQRWPDNIRAAYHALDVNEATSSPQGHTGQKTIARNSREFVVARQLKDADEKAFRARMAAEKTFDDAEKRLSTSLAREGCQKAILSWELHERAIVETEKVCC
jgi:cell wall assembly regulator SMI1